MTALKIIIFMVILPAIFEVLIWTVGYNLGGYEGLFAYLFTVVIAMYEVLFLVLIISAFGHGTSQNSKETLVKYVITKEIVDTVKDLPGENKFKDII